MGSGSSAPKTNRGGRRKSGGDASSVLVKYQDGGQVGVKMPAGSACEERIRGGR